MHFYNMSQLYYLISWYFSGYIRGIKFTEFSAFRSCCAKFTTVVPGKKHPILSNLKLCGSNSPASFAFSIIFDSFLNDLTVNILPTWASYSSFATNHILQISVAIPRSDSPSL